MKWTRARRVRACHRWHGVLMWGLDRAADTDKTLYAVAKEAGVHPANLRRYRKTGEGLSVDAWLAVAEVVGIGVGPVLRRRSAQDATAGPKAPETRPEGQAAHGGPTDAPVATPDPGPRAAEPKAERQRATPPAKPLPDRLPATRGQANPCSAASGQVNPVSAKDRMEADRKRYHPKVFAERVKAGYYS